MNFANFIPAILGILGLTAFQEKDGKKSLSDEERATLKGYGCLLYTSDAADEL